ncbi:MAG: hydrogenase [Actinomycetota bacterium]|nr:MAG: hydrogenase [Actinomycetota bacterium]
MLTVPLGSLAESLFSFLMTAALVLSFVMVGSHWLRNHIIAFATESWVIAVLSASVAYYGHYQELYIIAVLTALFRGMLLPYLLLRLVNRLDIHREFRPLFRPASGMLTGALLIVVAFALSSSIGDKLKVSNSIALMALTAMFGLMLIGFLLMVVRSEAISHILGLLVIENGIFLGSQILIPGFAILLELVILFDLLIIVMTFGILVRYLKTHAGTTSSQELQKLVG